jgi:hypothetical protein
MKKNFKKLEEGITNWLKEKLLKAGVNQFDTKFIPSKEVVMRPGTEYVITV